MNQALALYLPALAPVPDTSLMLAALPTVVCIPARLLPEPTYTRVVEVRAVFTTLGRSVEAARAL